MSTGWDHLRFFAYGFAYTRFPFKYLEDFRRYEKGGKGE